MNATSCSDAIKVLVLHADPVARAGLALACRSQPNVLVEEAGSAPESRLAVHVVVADYVSGLALALRNAGAPSPLPRVVIVGASDREWDVRRALERGVCGYLLAGCDLDEIALAVRAAARGVRHLSPQAAARLAESLYREPLTTREREVLGLVVDGLPNKSIATRLGIATGTVKSHLKSTFGKLNVQNRTQAVTLAQRQGLLERDAYAV